jgi:hypothetical protein
VTFKEFTKADPSAAEVFTQACFADDTRLVEREVLRAPRMSLHSPECWSYERGEGDSWIARGDWGEIWKWSDAAWRCVQERPFRSAR